MAALHLLCAGAAKGLVLAAQDDVERASGQPLLASFGAVGAMLERLNAGSPCDVIVLTRVMIDALAREGRVDAGSVADLGWVHTGVAVPQDAPWRTLADSTALLGLLGQASAVYLPDPQRATAGIHAKRLLDSLGLSGLVLRAFPNGAAAMGAMARDADPRAVGITQVSEILYTPGVRLLGALPAPHGLATLYSAAQCNSGVRGAAAALLLARLTGQCEAARRKQAGFEPV